MINGAQHMTQPSLGSQRNIHQLTEAVENILLQLRYSASDRNTSVAQFYSRMGFMRCWLHPLNFELHAFLIGSSTLLVSFKSLSFLCLTYSHVDATSNVLSHLFVKCTILLFNLFLQFSDMMEYEATWAVPVPSSILHPHSVPWFQTTLNSQDCLFLFVWPLSNSTTKAYVIAMFHTLSWVYGRISSEQISDLVSTTHGVQNQKQGRQILLLPYSLGASHCRYLWPS